MTAPTAQSLLPHPVPASGHLRLALYGIRRMAAGGIGDAHAASAFLMAFGIHYRRPLVLMRTLMSEMSRAAETKLLIAPCCCPRMSASEHMILRVLGAIENRPREAHTILCALLRVDMCQAVIGSAEALASCFSDLGKPLHPGDCV